MYEAAESRIKTLKLYSRDYLLAVNGNTYRVENESEKSELTELSSVLKEIGELKSLIAFLRNISHVTASSGSDSESLKTVFLEFNFLSIRNHIEQYKKTHGN